MECVVAGASQASSTKKATRCAPIMTREWQGMRFVLRKSNAQAAGMAFFGPCLSVSTGGLSRTTTSLELGDHLLGLFLNLATLFRSLESLRSGVFGFLCRLLDLSKALLQVGLVLGDHFWSHGLLLGRHAPLEASAKEMSGVTSAPSGQLDA